jgi:hypothetical protein
MKKKFTLKMLKLNKKFILKYFLQFEGGNWQILDNFDTIFECHLMTFDEKIWFIPNVI